MVGKKISLKVPFSVMSIDTVAVLLAGGVFIVGTVCVLQRRNQAKCKQAK